MSLCGGSLSEVLFGRVVLDKLLAKGLRMLRHGPGHYELLSFLRYRHKRLLLSRGRWH